MGLLLTVFKKLNKTVVLEFVLPSIKLSKNTVDSNLKCLRPTKSSSALTQITKYASSLKTGGRASIKKHNVLMSVTAV